MKAIIDKAKEMFGLDEKEDVIEDSNECVYDYMLGIDYDDRFDSAEQLKSKYPHLFA